MKCFVAETPVATGWTTEPILAAAPAGDLESDGSSTWIVVGTGFIVAAGIAYRINRKRRIDDESAAGLEELDDWFADGGIDDESLSTNDRAAKEHALDSEPFPAALADGEVGTDNRDPEATMIALQPKPRSSAISTPASQSRLGQLLWLVPLLLVGVCFWKGLPSGSIVGVIENPAVASTAAESKTRLATMPIQDVRIGQRVLANDPTVPARRPDTSIVPSDWRLLSLEMSKGDGSRVDITLLRPAFYLKMIGAEVGEQLYLDLPEMGAQGSCHIRSIDDCPRIQPGDGRLVTGTFSHIAATVYDLRVSAEGDPIGTTGNHPF